MVTLKISERRVHPTIVLLSAFGRLSLRRVAELEATAASAVAGAAHGGWPVELMLDLSGVEAVEMSAGSLAARSRPRLCGMRGCLLVTPQADLLLLGRLYCVGQRLGGGTEPAMVTTVEAAMQRLQCEEGEFVPVATPLAGRVDRRLLFPVQAPQAAFADRRHTRTAA